MGRRAGVAFGLPLVPALVIFAGLGVGMSLPYLFASWMPAVARLLPRPREWMVTFRKLMAFHMLAPWCGCSGCWDSTATR